MPKYLLLSGLQVALAEAVLWRWQAEQWHGLRRIAKHPELSGLLPLPAGRNSKIETKGPQMESQMELRWSSDGSKGSKRIQD